MARLRRERIGCSVVTDVQGIRNVADIAGWVLYSPSGQKAFARKILEKLRGKTDLLLIQQVLVAAASFMKHPGFSVEMEFRLLKFPDIANVEFRESVDRIVPFIDYLEGKTPLKVEKILIGPGWQLANLESDELAKHHVAQGIQRLLTCRRLDKTIVDCSRIPYDPR